MSTINRMAEGIARSKAGVAWWTHWFIKACRDPDVQDVPEALLVADCAVEENPDPPEGFLESIGLTPPPPSSELTAADEIRLLSLAFRELLSSAAFVREGEIS